MPSTANWSYPTAVRFGAGRMAELAEACISVGIKRPLLVTDRGLAGLPITRRATEILATADLEVALFAEGEANPTEDHLANGIAAFKNGGHDGVVAFGGGSGLDLGKLIAFMVDQTLPVWDFEDVDDWWTRANANAIKPLVAVPTTAGTGSEVGRAAVLTNSESLQKKIIFHPKLLPSVVIADAELTVAMPKALTAGTGMDAFAHCLEAYCSPHYHPMSHGIALEGMRLVQQNLLRAYHQPEDLSARAEMMSAAMMGAVAFQKGLGAIHALSHPIGAQHHTHHGTTNAVVMPKVLRFNQPAIESRLSKAANYLEISGGFEGFYDFVMTLCQDLSIPASLTDLGVNNADIPRLVRDALIDPSTAGNPVEMNTKNTTRLLESLFD